MKRLFISCVLLFSASFTYSQRFPIKFGKISIEDLKMTKYDKDTSAEAVVLADYGRFDANSFQFTRHYRIKILRKSGTSLANGILNVPNKSNLKAITYNLENGQIVESKLDKSSIYSEEIYEGLYVYRYFMPNVKEGSVIEVYYYHDGIPLEWRFQRSIPTIVSEVNIEPIQYIAFRNNFFGFEPIETLGQNHWRATNVPAFKDEPYMNSSENYITKFEFEITDIFYSSATLTIAHNFAKSWQAVGKNLEEASYFGEQLRKLMFMNSEAGEIKDLQMSEEEKLQKAVNLIKSKIKWNGSERLLASNDLGRIVNKEGTGNSADVNLTLVLLLNKIGIEAYPVVLSTRSNGLLSPVYPSLNKLNYVIALAKIKDQNILIDATEKYAPVGLLPERCLNLKGKVLKDHDLSDVDLVPDEKYQKVMIANLQLDENGKITGSLSCQSSGYAGLEARSQYNSLGEEEYVKQNYYLNPKMNVDGYEITNVDKLDESFKENIKVSFDYSNNDEIYFYPEFFGRMSANPFKNDKRKFPIDYGYLTDLRFIMTLQIPEGYNIQSVPEQIAFALPENGGRFTYMIQNNGNQIQFNSQFSINKVIFGQLDYPAVRQFYEQMIKKLGEQILIAKK